MLNKTPLVAFEPENCYMKGTAVKKSLKFLIKRGTEWTFLRILVYLALHSFYKIIFLGIFSSFLAFLASLIQTRHRICPSSILEKIKV